MTTSSTPVQRPNTQRQEAASRACPKRDRAFSRARTPRTSALPDSDPWPGRRRAKLGASSAKPGFLGGGG
eukprot:2592844-Alexandrium_andersonii.AAC.1